MPDCRPGAARCKRPRPRGRSTDRRRCPLEWAVTRRQRRPAGGGPNVGVVRAGGRTGLKVLLSEEEIRTGVRRLAGELSRHYQGENLTVVGVLTGSLMVLADLIRLLEVPVQIGLVQARSYRGATTQPGQLVVSAEHLPDLRDHHVLLVDDIFDTGRTLLELTCQIDDHAPRSLQSAVLLRKEGRCEVDLQPNHVAFDIPDEFVVGYGLDYNDRFRNLPYIAVLEPHELTEESSA